MEMTSARRLGFTGFGAFATGLAVLFLLGGFSPEAQALKVTLKRAVFEGPNRTATLTIINNTAEDQAYRLGWRQMRMTENQALVGVDDPADAVGLKPVDDLIRYAPRRILIPAGGTQQVRLLLRKPADLAEGEYRSHFWIQPEAESVKFAPPSAEMAEAAKTRPMVQIKMLTGITIPVIVRHGKLTVKATMTEARVSRDPDGKNMNVGFMINREGNRSIYGDLKFTCDGGVLAKQIKGVAVYTEVNKRFMNFSIPYPEGGAAACSKMKIEYIADADDMALKGASLASAEAAVQ